jgi:hypothetical protein
MAAERKWHSVIIFPGKGFNLRLYLMDNQIEHRPDELWPDKFVYVLASDEEIKEVKRQAGYHPRY